MLSKKLATIALDVPIEIDFDKMLIDNWNEENLLALFSELEFRTLAKRVLGADISNTAQKNTSTQAQRKISNGQLDLFANPDYAINIDENLPDGEIKTIETSARILIKSLRLFIGKFIYFQTGHLVADRKVCFIDKIMFCNSLKFIV